MQDQNSTISTTSDSVSAISLEPLECRTLMSVTIAPTGHDDTGAIAAAVNATHAGDVINFESGNYSISSTLNLPADRVYHGNGATLNGNNQGSVSIQNGSSTEFTGFTMNATPLFLNNAGGVNVHGDTFENISGGQAVSTNGVHDSIVSDNSFKSVSSGTGIYGQPGSNNQFDNNTFDYVFEAIHLVAGNGNNNTDVSGNHITHAQRHGIELQNPMNNLKVNNNWISDWVPSTEDGHDGHMGLSIAVGGWPDRNILGARNVEIAGNVILQTGPGQANDLWAKDGIEIMGGNVNVHDNYISGWGGGLLIGNDGTLTITNNTFVGDSTYGDYPNDAVPWTIVPAIKSGNQHYASQASAPAIPSPGGVTTSPPPTQTPTPNPVPSVAAATGLTATSPSTTEVDLSWTDNSAGQATYVLERRASHGAAGYASIATLAAGTTSYKDTSNVAGSWEYDYRLTAVAGGASSASTTVHVQAQIPVAPPAQNVGAGAGSVGGVSVTVAAPSNFTAVTPSSSEVDLAWTDNTAGSAKYVLQRRASHGSTGFVTIATLAARTTSYRDTSVNANWEYDYRLVAVSGSSSSSIATAHVQVRKASAARGDAGSSTLSAIGSERLATVTQAPSQRPDASAGTSKNGLRQVIYMSPSLQGRHVASNVATVNMKWGSALPDMRIGSGKSYGVQWKGHLKTPATDTYTLTVTADSNVRLYIDHRLVLDRWSGNATSGGSVTLKLKAGNHAIRLDYKEPAGGNAKVSLAWASSTLPMQIIPTQNLLAA